MTRFQRLALATAIATYLLVVIGGTVRVTDSGLSCIDWPKCNGSLLPSADGHVLIEYSHRLFASLVSMLVAATAFVAWRCFRRDRTIVVLASAAVGVLLLQIGLGGATVTQKLSAPVVTSHLGTAMLLLATVSLTAAVVIARTRPFARSTGAATGRVSAFRTAAFVAAGGTYVLLLTGAYTASSGAGTSCAGWPLCNGQIIPHDTTRYVQIHFVHRFTVFLVTIAFAVLVYGALRWLQGAPAVSRAVRDAFSLFVAQILVGALNVWTKLVTPVRVLHLAIGAALWVALVLVALAAYALTREGATATAVEDQRPARLPAHAGQASREVVR